MSTTTANRTRWFSRLAVATLIALFATLSPALGAEVTPVPQTPDLILKSAKVKYMADLDLLVFEQRVKGRAGGTLPKAAGQMDGAPVLGHVFPTTLKPEAIGFGSGEGIVALAVTSHPDFDDTPLWDENSDQDYANDGVVFHTHWVLLGKDDRVAGGLSVVEFRKEDTSIVLPPTNPGMPMYMDSPGFSVLLKGDTLRVLVPAKRLSNSLDFRYDAVTAYMQVNTDAPDRPLLGVYAVYSVLSGDLSLPYSVER